jgi:hypothetical protein
MSSTNPTSNSTDPKTFPEAFITDLSSSSQGGGKDVPPTPSRRDSFSAKFKNMLQRPLTHHERKQKKKEEKQQMEKAEREADIEAFLRGGKSYTKGGGTGE